MPFIRLLNSSENLKVYRGSIEIGLFTLQRQKHLLLQSDKYGTVVQQTFKMFSVFSFDKKLNVTLIVLFVLKMQP